MITFFSTGCTTMNLNKDDNKGKINSEQIRYETQNQGADNLGSSKPDYSKYEQSVRKLKELKEATEHGPDTDIFTNEEVEAVMDHLRKQEEIIDAQAAMSGDKIYVAVKLNNNGDQDIGNEIERQVREVVKNKEIIIYTDYSDWERSKDEGASKGAASLGKDLENMLENFFNVNVKE